MLLFQYEYREAYILLQDLIMNKGIFEEKIESYLLPVGNSTAHNYKIFQNKLNGQRHVISWTHDHVH